MKDKKKHINSWEELTDFVNQTNPFKQTIVLTGFVNRFEGDKLIIENLLFEQRSIDILEKNEKNDRKRKTTKKKAKKRK